MAYNNVNEQAGVGSAPSIPQKAAQGVQAEQLKGEISCGALHAF